jgi:hypothetical protein
MQRTCEQFHDNWWADYQRLEYEHSYVTHARTLRARSSAS